MSTISCMGDSLTYNYTLGVPPHLLYPAQLQKKLKDKYVVRNFGKSGNTTTQMINRFPAMTHFDVPQIGIIFGGVNDSGNSITPATTQSNIETMIQTLKNAGVERILVVTAQFLNYSTNGDFDTSNNPKDETTAYYSKVISAQKAAALSKNVPVCDLFNFLRNRIVSGKDERKSASWHVDGTDQHFNAYGCELVAQAVYEKLDSLGWV